VTRYNLPPADDPSSIESFLRLRRSQLPGGRPPIRGTREAAERQSAEHDGERIVDLLRRMPVEEYIPAADAGPEALEAAQYDWLRRHGLERGRVDASLGALRDDLNRRVHPSPSDPAGRDGGGGSARARPGNRSLDPCPPPCRRRTAHRSRPGGEARQRRRRASCGPQPGCLLSRLAREGDGLVSAAGSTSRSAPGVVDPGSGRYGRPNLVPDPGSGGPDRPIPALVPPARASSGASTGSTTGRANRRAPGGLGRRLT
jgi:hypothetical protein